MGQLQTHHIGQGGRLAAAVVGLSFLWPCLGSSATMSFRHAMANSASVITGQWHAVVMSVLYLVAIALCLAGRHRLEALLTGPRRTAAVVVAGAVGLVGHILLVGSPYLGDSVALVTGIVVVGFWFAIVFIVGHILAWGTWLTGVSTGKAVLAVVASNALSYAVQLGCNSLAAGALLGYLVLCPAGSAAGWALAVRKDAPPAAEPRETSLGIGAALRGLPWRLMGPTVALIYFEQVFSSLLFTRYAFWPRNNLTVTLAVGCVLWLAASVWARRLLAAEQRGPCDARRFNTALTGLFAALLVVYMGALLMTLVFPDGDGLVVERCLVAAGSSFRVLLWLAATVAIHQRRSTPVVGYLSYVFFVLALPVSRLASIVFDRMPAQIVADLTSPAAIVAAAGVMLFLIAAVFVIANTRGAHAADGGTDANGAHTEACRTVAREAGLSNRETSVLELVCRGYTAKRAGEKLGISESTVVSHMTHIYRKVGVGSKQELVALVEERAEG